MAFGVTNENIRPRFAVDNNNLGSAKDEFRSFLKKYNIKYDEKPERPVRNLFGINLYSSLSGKL